MTRWDEHLEPLVQHRYPALVAYARMLTGGDTAAAEDIVQDAIVRSFARSRRFTDRHHAENYVRRTISTVWIDAHRGRARLWRAYSKTAERDEESGPAAAVEGAVDVASALAQLSPRERACIVLRHYDDLSVKEIAHRLGLAEGTVKRYVHDASARLAHLLGTDRPADDVAAGHSIVQVREARS